MTGVLIREKREAGDAEMQKSPREDASRAGKRLEAPKGPPGGRPL